MQEGIYKLVEDAYNPTTKETWAKGSLIHVLPAIAMKQKGMIRWPDGTESYWGRNCSPLPELEFLMNRPFTARYGIAGTTVAPKFDDGEIIKLDNDGTLILWDGEKQISYNCGKTPEEYGPENMTDIEKRRIGLEGLYSLHWGDSDQFDIQGNALSIARVWTILSGLIDELSIVIKKAGHPATSIDLAQDALKQTTGNSDYYFVRRLEGESK